MSSRIDHRVREITTIAAYPPHAPKFQATQAVPPFPNHPYSSRAGLNPLPPTPAPPAPPPKKSYRPHQRQMYPPGLGKGHSPSPKHRQVFENICQLHGHVPKIQVYSPVVSPSPPEKALPARPKGPLDGFHPSVRGKPPVQVNISVDREGQALRDARRSRDLRSKGTLATIMDNIYHFISVIMIMIYGGSRSPAVRDVERDPYSLQGANRRPRGSQGYHLDM